MKVGDYVRTKDYQNIRSRIGKIIKQDGKYYYLDIDKDTQMVWEEDTVLKSSPNIIDLIKVGDYVNSIKVIKIEEYNDEKYIYVEEMEFCNACNEYEYVYYKEDTINSILTREQFESMEYKVGE